MSEEKDPAEKMEEATKRYFQSTKGKQALQRYLNSEKGKRARQRYHNSTKGKIASLKYYMSEKGKETREKRRQQRQLMVECQKYLEENPDKTVEDFLKEKQNG